MEVLKNHGIIQKLKLRSDGITQKIKLRNHGIAQKIKLKNHGTIQRTRLKLNSMTPKIKQNHGGDEYGEVSKLHSLIKMHKK